jgi:DNA-binding response OmpR family regulator
VERVTNAADGLKKLYESYPDLIIVARELPMVDGEDACLRMRQASYLPMIILGSQEEAAEMLELGADAYMTKPLSSSELVARVHALLRRKPRFGPPSNDIRLEIEKHLPRDGGGSNGLSITEYRLASCLIFNKGRFMGYNRLITEVWGGRGASLDNLHFYIRRLRSKLAHGSIFGVRGLGYCFKGLASE